MLRLVRPRVAAARLSRFAVWRFEALWERGWHVGALAVRKRVRGASGPRDAGVRGRVALASCVRGRGCVDGVRRAVGGCATLLLSVTGVTHAPWNKCAATGVTRVGRVVFVRGELTCC